MHCKSFQRRIDKSQTSFVVPSTKHAQGLYSKVRQWCVQLLLNLLMCALVQNPAQNTSGGVESVEWPTEHRVLFCS